MMHLKVRKTLSEVVKELEERQKQKEMEMEKCSWQSIPNEIKALVVEHFDLQTSLALRSCSRKERDLVDEYSYNLVNIHVKYSKIGDGKRGKGVMTIDMKDANTENNDLVSRWSISRHKKSSSIILLEGSNNGMNDTRVARGKSVAKSTFRIVARLCNHPRFEVNDLMLELNRFSGRVQFNRRITNIERLVVKNCHRKAVLHDILMNMHIRPENISGCYGNKEKEGRKLYGSMLMSRMNALALVRLFVSKISPFEHMVENEDLRNKVESRENINNFMYVYAAFSKSSKIVAYLRDTDEGYEETIQQLRTGVDPNDLMKTELEMLLAYSLVKIKDNRLRRIQKGVLEIYMNMFDKSCRRQLGLLLLNKSEELYQRLCDIPQER